MENKQQTIARQENESLVPLRDNVSSQENEKYRLLQHKTY